MNNKIVELVSIFLFAKSGNMPIDYDGWLKYFDLNEDICNNRLRRLIKKYGTR
jgi:hypothetical protein